MIILRFSVNAFFFFDLENINLRDKNRGQHPFNHHVGPPIGKIAGHIKERLIKNKREFSYDKNICCTEYYQKLKAFYSY